jgi:ElaB/YqjD/DUF883 family membrane-anchored ribosome-binding protein
MTDTNNDTGTQTGTETGVRGRVRDAAGSAKTKASDAYYAARERTSSALETASERASRARQTTSEGIDSNPIGALIGGLALGGLLAAVLPRSQREEELLGDYGRRINDRAREAARVAREAGQNKLDELGYNKENARAKIQSLRSDVKEVASAAAERAKSPEGQ